MRQIFFAIFAIVQLALLVLWTQPSITGTQATVANAAVTFVGALFLGLLSWAEHQRNVQPSLILNLYLLLTLVFDAARVRTLWLRGFCGSVAILMTVAFALKTILVVLEAQSKRDILRAPYSSYPPEATSGVYNRALFLWLNPLFRTGYKQILTVQNLFPLDKHLTSDYLFSLIQPTWLTRSDKKGHALLWHVCYKIKWHLLAAVPWRLALTGFTYTQPFLIERAIEIASAPSSSETTQAGYGMIAAYFLVYSGISITFGQYMHHTYRAITMTRGGLISMLFAKAALLDLRAIDPASSTTLMSADIERITNGWMTLHDMWSNVIEIGLAIYLLERQLGAACGIPVAVAVFAFAAATVVSGAVVSRQAMWLEAIEKRIQSTTNMLGAMKRVKMCGLIDTLSSQLHQLRVDELRISKKFRQLIIVNLVFAYVTPIIAPVVTFAVFSILALRSSGTSTLNPARAFTAYSLFALLSDPLATLIMAMTNFAGSVGCFDRIQAFLEGQEHVDGRIKSTRLPDDDPNDSQNSTSTLSGATPRNNVPVAVVKQSLDEKHGAQIDGITIENGSFGWDTAQDPLLRSVDLHAPPAKLTMVVGSVGCGKSTLLKAMLGEVPILSGKIHTPDVSVAYCDQSPFHMNGTIKECIVAFSEWDPEWYRTVLTACAFDDDLATMPAGDDTVVGSKGIAISGGQSQRLSIARAVYARYDLCILDDVLSGLDVETENRVFHNLFGVKGLLRRFATTTIVASSSGKRIPYADHVVVLDDKGFVQEQGSFDELNAQSGYVSGLNLKTADWNYGVEKASPEDAKLSSKEVLELKSTVQATVPVDEAAASRQSGDLTIYLYYIGSVGWTATIIFMVAISIYAFGYTFPTVWLKWWADANLQAPNQNLGYWLGVYAALGVIALSALGISCWQLIVTMVPLSGTSFHRKLLDTVLGAPMSFFSTVDTGITLNRFSQDLQLIDMDLPISALNFAATFVLCLANMIVIGVSSVWAAISYPILLVSLYFIQRFYLRTSRQLRFLDLEAKSPLYSQFVETLSGLVTVRAFGWEKPIEKKNWHLLDLSQRPFYLLWAVQRWLTVVLDFMVAGIAVLLIVLVTQLRNFVGPGFAGVALANIVLFSQQLRMLMTFWTQLETHIGAISRVKMFTEETESEHLPSENGKLPPGWPSQGAIDFQSLTARYGSNTVLKDLNFSIPAGQKVAICGRTGSGKSSLVMTIFRMVDYSGTILVDGVDLSTIPRQTIRASIVGLPQDSFLLTGSVRLNADPSSKIADSSIVEALRDVGLWDTIQERGGLDAYVDDVHLSHGQKQLFSLAHALLRPSSILILDEATSR